MNKLIHKALLLCFLLTSIGQFAYACIDDSSEKHSRNVCCCDDAMLKSDNGCDMTMSQPVANSEPCCDIDFQVSNSDGSKADSTPAQLHKSSVFKSDPGTDPPAIVETGALFSQQAPGEIASSLPTSNYFHPSGRSLYLDTLRLRI